MITNFEEYTEELTDEEKNNIVPLLVRGLQTKIGKDNAITSTDMITAMKKYNHKIGGAKLRKLIQYIRMTGLVERLVATSKGYYICNREDEMNAYIESLLQRSAQINMIAKQMDFQFKKYNDGSKQ